MTTLNPLITMGDPVLPFQFGIVRGRMVRLDSTIRSIMSRHTAYPPVVQRYLAEATALTIAVSNCFKFDGVFTLQITGNGPVRLMVVDVNSNGHVRACARLTEDAVFGDKATLSVQELFGAGYLAFTIDQDKQEDRYQGIVELTGATLSDCMHHFFHQSEQLDTGILVVSHDFSELPAEGPVVGALMVQKMPSQSTDDQDQWVKTVSTVSTLHTKEFLTPTLTMEDLLYRLFWADNAQIFPEKTVKDQCRCSRDKIFLMLQTFERTDLEEMVVNDYIDVTCEFCSTAYVFTLTDFIVDAPIPDQ